MPDLEYKITTTAEGSGAKQTAQEIDELNQKAGAGAGAVEELGKQEALATEKTEGLHVEARGLHSALFLIARESGPAVGAAISGAAALMTGGLLAAVFAVRELFEWIEQLRQKAEEFREQQASLWLAIQKGAADAATAQDDYNSKIAESKGNVDALKTAYEQSEAILTAQVDSHKQILDAIEKEQLAEAGGDKQKEEAIKERFAGLKASSDLEAGRSRIALEQSRLSGLQLEKSNTEPDSFWIEHALEQAKANDAVLQERLKNAMPKDSSEAKLKADAVVGQQQIDKLKQEYADYYKSSGIAASPQMIEAQARVANPAAFKAVSDFQNYEAAKDAAEASTKAIHGLQKELDKSVESLSALNTSIAEEQAKIATMQKVQGLKEGAAVTERDIGFITNAGGPQKFVEQAASAFQALEAGQKLNESQQAILKAFVDFSRDHGAANNQIAEVLRMLVSSDAARKEEIVAIKRELASRLQSHLTQ